MFSRPPVSPDELYELREILVKIETIQYFCKKQVDMYIGFRDPLYEQAGSITYNADLKRENDRLVAMQEALVPRCRELKNKIANDQVFNQIALAARKEVIEALKAGKLKYPSDTNNSVYRP